MAVGDDARAANYPLVPDTGEEGRVRWGAREINRTRDFIALVKQMIPGSKSEYRAAVGISAGKVNPSPQGGSNGDIYFKIVG